MDIGATYLGENRCRFRVWAPLAGNLVLHLLPPRERLVQLERDEKGYCSATLKDVPPGTEYLYRFDEKERPDPCSRYQPQTVHGPSQVVDPEAYEWQDGDWGGIELRDYLFYELHVGTFTPEGTFEAVMPRIAQLKELGITSVEIMPVAQFPGKRNWGYDGVLPFAVQNAYGGPTGLKRLVDACHRQKIAVTLDVVYNHLGPEGNYLREFGPYFTTRYKTPWGDALNFDDAYSDEVRHYFIQNALYWLDEFHVDALRLDAVHAIYDFSAVPFLQELAEEVDAFGRRDGRPRYLIAESDLNDTRLIRPRTTWGYGLDAQWSDDFHHCLHALLTGEQDGYYADFADFGCLQKALCEGFVYSGQYSAYRRRRHGNYSADLAPEKFVAALQNHDQVGNRMNGERLSALISFEACKTAAAALILSPYLPLIFMGQEYGETAPFLYFISHEDPELTEAIRRGRQAEFSRFGWQAQPPDPAARKTFTRSRVQWEMREKGRHRLLNHFYRELIRLRHSLPALRHPGRDRLDAVGAGERRLLIVHRWCEQDRALLLFNFDSRRVLISSAAVPAGAGWKRMLDSADPRWGGPGSTLPEKWPGSGSVIVPAFGASVFVSE